MTLLQPAALSMAAAAAADETATLFDLVQPASMGAAVALAVALALASLGAFAAAAAGAAQATAGTEAVARFASIPGDSHDLRSHQTISSRQHH